MQWDQQIFIAGLNVQHFRRRLADNLEDGQRRTIVALLAEEEAKLSRLTAAAAERDLSTLIDLLAQRSSVLLDGSADEHKAGFRTRLTRILQHAPFGLGLAGHDGRLIMANDHLARLVPKKIPRDRSGIGQVQLDTEDGSLHLFPWPGERAMRGEAVNPGVEATLTAQDGQEITLRVAAVPVRDGEAGIVGMIAAAYDLETLGHDETRQNIGLLVAEEMRRSVRQGTTGHN